MEINKVIILAFLLFCAVIDLKTRRVYLAPCVFVSLLGIVTNFITGNLQWEEFLGTVFFIFIMYILRKLFNNEIGKGDIWVTAVVSVCIGVEGGLLVLLYGMIIAAVIALVLIICKRADRRQKIPLVPFILTGYVIFLGIC